MTSMEPTSSPAPALAQTSEYDIDHQRDLCLTRVKGNIHAAYAYSALGVSGCTYGPIPAAKMRQEAIDLCTRRTPAQYRAVSPCRAVSEDKRIVDTRFFASQRQPQRIPVSLEIYDDPTKKLQTASGFVVTGKYVDQKSVPVQLVLASGLVICTGTANETLFEPTFSATCFGKGPFSGRSKFTSRNFVKFGGVFFLPFKVLIRDGKSYIQGQTVAGG